MLVTDGSAAKLGNLGRATDGGTPSWTMSWPTVVFKLENRMHASLQEDHSYHGRDMKHEIVLQQGQPENMGRHLSLK